MKHVTNFPLFNGCTREYGNMAGVVRDYAEVGMDGLEVIWDHEPYTEELPPTQAVIGYHLMFFSCWLDFWRGNWQGLLDEYDNKGIMLDTGHLMSTNVELRTQKQAADYIRRMYDAHGDLGQYVRGLHLHKSLSGEYVQNWGYRLPDDMPEGYWERYSRTYQHIIQVDRHEPWDDPVVADLVRHLDPEWVNHELSAWPREPHLAAVRTQMQALGL